VETIVLGYDIRTPVADQKLNWEEDRRNKFLIQPMTSYPVSVDRIVWPALIDNSDVGHPYRLWGSAREALVELEKISSLACAIPEVIQIAVLTADQQSARDWNELLFGYVHSKQDTELAIAWEHLGYDVADRDLISGMSNCMLQPLELAEIRAGWTEALNTWGLFVAFERAIAFTRICDQLILGHSPFEVYRLLRARGLPSGYERHRSANPLK
jgi:hypothetical protein